MSWTPKKKKKKREEAENVDAQHICAIQTAPIILLILKMFVCNCSRKNLNWLDQEVLCPPSRKDTVTALKNKV